VRANISARGNEIHSVLIIFIPNQMIARWFFLRRLQSLAQILYRFRKNRTTLGNTPALLVLQSRLIDLFTASSHLKENDTLFSLRKLERRYGTITNLRLAVPSNLMALEVGAFSTNYPCSTNIWCHHERVSWTVFLGHSHRTEPKLVWKSCQYFLYHWIRFAKLLPLLYL